MKNMYSISIKKAIVVFCVLLLTVFLIHEARAAMEDYCIVPPFVSRSVPPLVMFEVGREHKLYYEAYNDASDFDDDGRLDVDYKHSIDYYGYFDYNKCYTYSGSEFNPVSVANNKFCGAGQWSGNVLNWLAMSRVDVLKKVLFGGNRYTDTSARTVLERVYIPQDAHSWGKELTGRLCYNGNTYSYNCARNSDCGPGETCVDRSQQLIGIAAATPPNDCSFTSTINNISGGILVARYSRSGVVSEDLQCGIDHANLINSYQPENLIDTFRVTGFDDVRLNTEPQRNNYDNYNIIAVAEFNVSDAQRGNWQFAVDGDDGVEVEINGVVVASYFGCHARCWSSALPGTPCDVTQIGTININTAGWHRIIVRHTERTGFDGVKVWYNRPGSGGGVWRLFTAANLGSSNLRTPNIVSGAECTLRFAQFIATGIPVLGEPGRQHLFCSTTLSDGGTPIMRRLENRRNRIWEWASKERPVCGGTFADGSSVGTPTDYTVRVEVCNSSAGLEPNCKNYNGTYKPIGLLQKYGEGEPNDRVCSKTFAKRCIADSDCNIATEGMCIDRAQMYFGMMSTSYTRNLSGGVLRKNIGSITDEINPGNGIFLTSENSHGNILLTLNRLKTVGFRYSDYSYQDAAGGSCGWITSRALNEGECRMWGNPIAEMMYESLRYFAGKGSPTPAFTYAGATDSGLSLSKPAWGHNKGGTLYQPYQLFPSCARPFILVLSDINPSYDHDQLPGSAFSGFAEDAANPRLNINVSALTNAIGSYESIAGRDWYIGESGNLNDYICSSKNVSNLSLLKGLCPEEPTKKGTYYSAAVAYYGRTLMNTNTGKPNVNTYAVALSSPVADLKIKAGSNYVTIVPIGKSVSGSHGVFTACANRCTFSQDSSDRFSSTCSANAYCPSNQIVDVYADSVRYDANNNVIYARFRINYEDVEQGADHDMDVVVNYEICTQAAVDEGYGTCGGTLGSGVQVKLRVEYAAGSIDQILGFVISGTSEDGVYLPVRDLDVSAPDGDTPAFVAGLPTSWSKTFTVTGNPTGFMKNPLWYAAKWGGFDDVDDDNRPYTDSSCGTASPHRKCAEWDKDGDGDPDNYYLVVNPLKLEEQLEKALLSILRRASSGTAASVLASGEGQGANLIQAVFHPKRLFGSQEISWTGSMQNLWYYIDPSLKHSTIREDTVEDKDLKINQDYILHMFFDELDQKTKAHRFEGNDDGSEGDPQPTVELEELKNLWEAGSLLHRRNTPRTIKTSLDGVTLINFDEGAAGVLQSFLDADNHTHAQNIIRYVRGESDIDPQLYRDRSVVHNELPGIWKLGDIVSSTPRVVSWIPLNNYHKKYLDRTYKDFVDAGVAGAYRNRGKIIGGVHYGSGMVFTGANDGMLHAFKLGAFDIVNDGSTKKASLKGADMGKEEWAFIPRNALPYLKYLMDKDYCHLYYVDATPVVFDASIGPPTVTGDYWNETKTKASWRTILIGGMRLGGACKALPSAYGVKAPLADTGYSSYFALDITDPSNPSLLWEFSRPEDNDLGFTTTGPAIVKINARNGGGNISSPDKDKNGRWFVVFASGPTGPITDLQFKGFSDQNLKLFILDLKTGQVARVIDTEIQYAFGGSLNNASIDYDKDYQDDAVYIGYTMAERIPPAADTKWTNGGVIRLITKEDLNGSDVSATGNMALNPQIWSWSRVTRDTIGPVTSAVGVLAHYPTTSRMPDKAWLYFGTGRFFYREDDMPTARSIFGIKEKCLTKINNIQTAGDPACDNSDIVLLGDLDDATINMPSEESPNGWYITLDPSERVITDPLASTIGAVFFTTLTPSADICEYGGSSYLWAVKHDTGGEIASSLRGTALLQVSTGVIEEKNLKSAFTQKSGRRTAAMIGVPPTGQGLQILTQPPPVKRVIHMRER